MFLEDLKTNPSNDLKPMLMGFLKFRSKKMLLGSD